MGGRCGDNDDKTQGIGHAVQCCVSRSLKLFQTEIKQLFSQLFTVKLNSMGAFWNYINYYIFICCCYTCASAEYIKLSRTKTFSAFFLFLPVFAKLLCQRLPSDSVRVSLDDEY